MRLLPFIAWLGLITSCNQADNPLIGSWKPQKYVLASGESKPVDGHIFFSGDQWSVVFFILDEDKKPVSASAEGGTYTLENNNLTFFDRYNISDVDKGVASELKKTLRTDNEEFTKEYCSIEVEEGILVIYFPSGNAMIFSQL